MVHQMVTVLGINENMIAESEIPFQENDSWFDGYEWKPISCYECGNHLGWYFLSITLLCPESFYGLVRNNILTQVK